MYLGCEYDAEAVGVLIPRESLDHDKTRPDSLGTFCLDDVVLYTASTEELPILNKVASNFQNNPTKSATFHAHTFYTMIGTLLEKLRDVLVEHRTDCSGAVVALLNTLMYHTGTTSIHLSQIFCSCVSLHNYDPREKKVSWKALSEVLQRRIIRNNRKLLSYSDPTQLEKMVF